MACPAIKSGALVTLPEIQPSSPFHGEGASLKSNWEAVLQARVGRNIDGFDLNFYRHSLQFLRQFQADCMTNPAT